MVAMEILLPWQQDRLLISQLFRGVETPVLVWRYFLAKNNHFQGVRSGDELSVICTFDQICKQKIIDILHNIKKLSLQS